MINKLLNTKKRDKKERWEDAVNKKKEKRDFNVLKFLCPNLNFH